MRKNIFWQSILATLLVVVAPGRARSNYMNDTHYHTLFLRQNCACSSPIHPQARFCGADLVVAGILKAVRHGPCNFSVAMNKQPGKGKGTNANVNWNSGLRCTDLHFIASDVLHMTANPGKQSSLAKALDRVRRSRKVVLTIPKSNISTCNFDIVPTLGQQYIVSANFIGKRFYTYSCYHLFELWRDLNAIQRKAYTKQYYESSCSCQIVQNSFYVRFEWPRRPTPTTRSKQCWWQPGSTDVTANFDRTAFCKAHGSGGEGRCEWQVLAKRPILDQPRRLSLKPASDTTPASTSASAPMQLIEFNATVTASMSNEIPVEVGYFNNDSE